MSDAERPVKRKRYRIGKDGPQRGPERVPGGVILAVEKYNLSVAQLGRHLGISGAAAHRKLYGWRKWTYDDLWKLAEALNVPIKWLVD